MKYHRVQSYVRTAEEKVNSVEFIICDNKNTQILHMNFNIWTNTQMTTDETNKTQIWEHQTV